MKNENPFKGMPHPYQKEGGAELDMEWFKKDTAAWKEQDQDPHWRDINIDELDSYDARTWMLFRAGTLTPKDFEMRRAAMNREHPMADMKAMMGDSRHNFYAFLGNEVSEKLALEEIARMDTQEAQK